MKKLRNIFSGSRLQSFLIPVVSLIISLLAASVLLLVLGKNPPAGFKAILQGSGILPKASAAYRAGTNVLSDFTYTLSMLVPMVFASLAVCVALKTGLFNIGVSGQMLIAGFAATVFIGYSNFPSYAAVPLSLIIGIIAGAAAGGLIGVLKSKFNINEVVTSIMLNYIISYVTGYFLNTKYINMVTHVSNPVKKQTLNVLRYTVTDGSFKELRIGGFIVQIPYMLIFGIIAAAALLFFFSKTRPGLELRAVGSNPKASRYFGISPSRSMMYSMLISGALAGLAGVTYYMGLYETITPNSLTSTGFDAIAVTLLGASNPLGCLIAAFLITVISNGTTFMTSQLHINREIPQVITGIILLFAACGEFFKYLLNKKRVD